MGNNRERRRARQEEREAEGRTGQGPGKGEPSGRPRTGQNAPDEPWRMPGIPEETRFADMCDAIKRGRAVRSVQNMRLRGRKETGGRRPCRITAERIQHSRSRRLVDFMDKFRSLNGYEKQLLFDGRAIGGLGTFGDFKESEFKSWKVVKSQVVLEMTSGSFVTVEREDGTFELVPHVDEEWDKIQADRAEQGRLKSRVWSTPGAVKPDGMSWREWVERGGEVEPMPVVHREFAGGRQTLGGKKKEKKETREGNSLSVSPTKLQDLWGKVEEVIE